MTKLRQKISFQNFFEETKATFTDCEIPNRTPDYISDSGSKYWYGEDENGEHVTRYSDHWSNIEVNGEEVYSVDLFLDSNGAKIDDSVWGVSIPSYFSIVEIRNIKRNVASCFWSLNIQRKEHGGAGKAYLHNFTPNKSSEEILLNEAINAYNNSKFKRDSNSVSDFVSSFLAERN